MSLSGKAVGITGAGRGIGRATALLMAKEGARVLVNDYGVSVDGRDPSSEPASQVAAEINKAGGSAVSNTDTVDTMKGAGNIVQSCIDQFGKIDILVNNAGIIIRKFMVDTLEDDWDRQVSVSLKGTFLCTKFAADHMIRQGYGRIINYTSRGGLMGTPGCAAYGAAKEGVVGFTRVIARELAFHNITVNLVTPGADTRMNSGISDEILDMMAAYGFTSSSPSNDTIPGPEAVAPLVAYLASDEAGYINGQIVGITGENLQLWSQPDPVRVAFMPGGWSVETMHSHFATTLGKDLANPIPSLSTSVGRTKTKRKT